MKSKSKILFIVFAVFAALCLLIFIIPSVGIMVLQPGLHSQIQNSLTLKYFNQDPTGVSGIGSLIGTALVYVLILWAFVSLIISITIKKFGGIKATSILLSTAIAPVAVLSLIPGYADFGFRGAKELLSSGDYKDIIVFVAFICLILLTLSYYLFTFIALLCGFIHCANLEKNEEKSTSLKLPSTVTQKIEVAATNELSDSLKSAIKEVLRDELSRLSANLTRTDVKEQNPVVVQYFSGYGQKAQPIAHEDVKIVDAKPAEKVEEKSEPVCEEVMISEEKNKIVRIPFEKRIVSADKEMKDNYNELKNDIMAYGVNSRLSGSGDTFRLHCKTYVKLTVAGKSLKLYLALDPSAYADSTLPIKDAGNKAIYSEIPLVFKVKSGLSLRRAKQLIKEAMEKDGLTQKEVGKTDWVKEIQNSK